MCSDQKHILTPSGVFRNTCGPYRPLGLLETARDWAAPIVRTQYASKIHDSSNFLTQPFFLRVSTIRSGCPYFVPEIVPASSQTLFKKERRTCWRIDYRKATVLFAGNDAGK